MSQWQPNLGVYPQDTIYFQALPSHLSFPNSEPLHVNFNSMLKSDWREDPSEGPPPQMSSEMLDVIPAAPSATANMLPVGQRVPTSRDWESYRHAIVKLYIDEDRTLKDVMHIMRTQHGFNATVKMYKTRLANWDVRKYMTPAEREEGRHVLELKQAAGETCGKIIVRGKARNPDVFLRHMGQSRAGIRRKKLLVNGKNLQDIVVDTHKTNLSGSQTWAPMYPAGSERIIEIVCKEMSSLVLNTMMLHASTFGAELFQLLIVGQDRFRKNRPAEVRVLLNRAATWFADTIKLQPSKALLAVLESRAGVLDSSFVASDLLACFDRHLFDLIRDRCGSQHSLTKLLMHILQMENDFEVMQHMYRSLLLMIISDSNRRSDLWAWYLELADSFESSGQYRKAEGLLLDAVNSFDSETSRKDSSKAVCNFDLAWHYIEYQEDMDDEAERILIAIREAGTDEVTGEVDLYHTYLAASGLGRLAEKRGENEAAVTFYRLRIQAAHDVRGVDSVQGMHAAADLADYLWKLGRDEEAMEAESLVRLTDEFSELDLE